MIQESLCITEFLVLKEPISVPLRQTEGFVRNKDIADKIPDDPILLTEIRDR